MKLKSLYMEQGYSNYIFFILTFLDLSNASRTNSVAGLPPSPNPSDGVTSVGQSRKWHKTSLGGMIRNASSISEKGKYSNNYCFLGVFQTTVKMLHMCYLFTFQLILFHYLVSVPVQNWV